MERFSKRVDDRSQDGCQGAELADGLRREGERQESGRTAIVKYAGPGCWAWAAGIPCQDFETRSSTSSPCPVRSPFPVAVSTNRCTRPASPSSGPGGVHHVQFRAGGVRWWVCDRRREARGESERVRVRIGWCCMKERGVSPPKLLAQRRRLICRAANSPSLPVCPISSAIVMSPLPGLARPSFLN